jgi:hypothetical protein
MAALKPRRSIACSIAARSRPNASTFAGASAIAPSSCSFSSPSRAAQHMTLEKV